MEERADQGAERVGTKKKLVPETLTRMLKDGLFRGYYIMLIKLKTVPAHCKQWFEKCPCHEGVMFSERGSRGRRKALIRDGVREGDCMFMSCRIWELIDEGNEIIFKRLKENTLSDLVQALQDMQRDGVTDLTDEHIALIIDDFERACQHYFLAFAVKFAWTRWFPWILMVLSHPVVETAWKWAGIIVTKFNAHTGPVDRRTANCLDPFSKLRPELDDFIRTKNMSAVLQIEVGLFRFVPLSDRPAEAEHVYLKVLFVRRITFT